MYLNNFLEVYGVGEFSLNVFSSHGIPEEAINHADSSIWDVVDFCFFECIQISEKEIAAGLRLIDAGYFATRAMGAKIKPRY